MEHTMTREPIWKMWVDTRRRVVSFHEEAGAQLMEFRDREMFLRCVAMVLSEQFLCSESSRGLLPSACGFLYQSAVPLSVNA
mgnify:CR=1 FL=1